MVPSIVVFFSMFLMYRMQQTFYEQTNMIIFYATNTLKYY